MKDLVSRRIHLAASISAFVIVWAMFVSPQGHWAGFVALGAMAVLLTTTTVLWTRRTAPVPAILTVPIDGQHQKGIR
jgi:hypothetical protein